MSGGQSAHVEYSVLSERAMPASLCIYGIGTGAKWSDGERMTSSDEP